MIMEHERAGAVLRKNAIPDGKGWSCALAVRGHRVPDRKKKALESVLFEPVRQVHVVVGGHDLFLRVRGFMQALERANQS